MWHSVMLVITQAIHPVPADCACLCMDGKPTTLCRSVEQARRRHTLCDPGIACPPLMSQSLLRPSVANQTADNETAVEGIAAHDTATDETTAKRTVETLRAEARESGHSGHSGYNESVKEVGPLPAPR